MSALSRSRAGQTRCFITAELPDQTTGVTGISTYRVGYGGDEQVVRETFRDVDDVQRVDGWVVFFRGPDAFLRVREEHVQTLELIEES